MWLTNMVLRDAQQKIRELQEELSHKDWDIQQKIRELQEELSHKDWDIQQANDRADQKSRMLSRAQVMARIDERAIMWHQSGGTFPAILRITPKYMADFIMDTGETARLVSSMGMETIQCHETYFGTLEMHVERGIPHDLEIVAKD